MRDMVETFRSTQQVELQRHTNGELPEESIFNLLSSVGNAENHGLMVIVMKKGVTYSRRFHYKELLSHQIEGSEWKTGGIVPLYHCEASLLPAQVVTREVVNTPRGAIWGHQITNYGLDPGIPFIGILLKWSHEHPNHSLYKMFGTRRLLGVSDEYTQEIRSAQKTRCSILGQISKSTDMITQRDILYATDEGQTTIGYHIRTLAKNGVVTQNSIRTRKSIISVSSEQKKAIVSLLTEIDRFKNGDRETIEEGRKFAERVLNDPDLFSELMLKAKEASPFANKKSKENFFFAVDRK